MKNLIEGKTLLVKLEKNLGFGLLNILVCKKTKQTKTEVFINGIWNIIENVNVI